MHLILIRHAETDGNRHAYVGREDLPLNEAGRRQAVALADALSGIALHRVLSSPLVRARDTAAAIADGRSLAIDVRPELVEIDFGHLQGMPKHEAPLDLKRLHHETPLPGGESLRDVEHRLQPLVEELPDLIQSGQPIAIVSHYWACRVLLGLLTADATGGSGICRNYKPGNASAFEISFARSGAALAVQSTRWLHAKQNSG